MRACVGKETVFTRRVKCVREKVTKMEFGKSGAKKRNIIGELNVFRYVICCRMGSECSWLVHRCCAYEVDGCDVE